MALHGTNQELGKPFSRRIVLEAIRLHGPIKRAENAKRVGACFAGDLTIENLFDPTTIVLDGTAPKVLLVRQVDRAAPLPNPVAVWCSRSVDRLILTAAGHDAVLSGTAALAVLGVRSPRFGTMFTSDDDRRDCDPIAHRSDVVRAA